MPGRWYLSTPALKVSQPFEFGTLSACSRINIADDGGDLSFELFGDDGRPCHVATLCRIAYEFLRHAFGCTHKLRLLGWRQRQAIDDKFAVILDSTRPALGQT